MRLVVYYNQVKGKNKREVNKMTALTIFTIVASIVGLVLVGFMGIIVAYEVTPLDEMPAWLDKAYDRVEKVLDKLFY